LGGNINKSFEKEDLVLLRNNDRYYQKPTIRRDTFFLIRLSTSLLRLLPFCIHLTPFFRIACLLIWIWS